MMQTGLDHLPPQKQRELERVVQLILEEFEDACALAKHECGKASRILKVILHGSYARESWVDESHTGEGHQSDYDLLIIVNDERLTDRIKYWSKLDDRLMREYGVTSTLKAPVNFIVNTLREVNEGIAHGRYLFMDVAHDAVLLYQSDKTDLHRPNPKSPERALAMAQEYFDDWFPGGAGRLDTARYNAGQGRLKEAAFDTHQAAEFLYHCVLLVCTFYTPHVHNLSFLRTQAERIDSRLNSVWPDRTRFEKLQEAHGKARFSKHYHIAKDELERVWEQVEELGRVVHRVCTERIDKLRQDVEWQVMIEFAP